MLLCTKNHFIKSLAQVLDGHEGSGSDEERRRTGQEMMKRIQDYATDDTGLNPACEVWSWEAKTPGRKSSQSTGDKRSPGNRRSSQTHGNARAERGSCRQLVNGKPPRRGQQIVYVDGAFDLFSCGHTEFLRCVTQAEEESAAGRGWYDGAAKQKRIAECGEDYGPAYIVAGIHDDEAVNYWKGINYPIMNIFERGLCVLQCKVRFLSPYRQNLLTAIPVYSCRHFCRTLYYLGLLSQVLTLRRLTFVRISRPYFFC